MNKYAKLFPENYRVIEKIGEGGNGIVFLGEQQSTNQKVALKSLKFSNHLLPEQKKRQIARFERETRLCAEINHPCIVKILDKGYDNAGNPFAVFEYLKGDTLKELIQRKEGLSSNLVKELMGQVLEGLVCAHEHGIVHRDLKPQNIMVYKSGAKTYAKILDFGIGAFAGDFSPVEYTNITMTQDVIGTPSYSAPEQLRGEPSTLISDLYSWGLVLLECLTGRQVISGNTIAEVFQQQLAISNIPLPPVLIDHPLGILLRKVLEKNPHKRLQTAAATLKSFSKINFSTIVGNLKLNEKKSLKLLDDTQLNLSNNSTTAISRKQITVLCLKLDTNIPKQSELDLEIVEAIHRDQLSLLQDQVIKYGGYYAASLLNHVIVYFGFPHSTDNDARRAGKTALEVLKEVKRRNTILKASHGFEFRTSITIHTGMVIVHKNELPAGNIPTTALEMLSGPSENQILISNEAKHLLAPHYVVEAYQSTNNFILHKEKKSIALFNLKPWAQNTKIVGREKELKLFTDTWKDVESNKRAILIHGEAGVGKSRLAYRIKNWVKDEDSMVLEMAFLPEFKNNALHPIFSLIRSQLKLNLVNQKEQLKRLRKMLSDIEVDVEQCLPFFCSWLNIEIETNNQELQIAPEKQKKIVLSCLVSYLDKQNDNSPFLMLFEDVHWIDPTSQELVKMLLELKDRNCFILFTSRNNETFKDYEERLIKCRVNPLNLRHIDSLVQQVVKGISVADEVVEYIADRSDGIPLFVEELTRMLIESEVIVQKDEVYIFSKPIDKEDIPTTIKDLLHARLDHQSFSRETAQVASVIGRNFNRELLIQTVELDEEIVIAQLENLIQSDLVICYEENKIYGFRHALIRDAAYDSMVTTVRKSVHGNLAKVLEENFPEISAAQPFELAQHLASSDQYKKAGKLGMKAANNALEKSLNQEVVEIVRNITEWGEKDVELSNDLDFKLASNSLNINALMSIHGWAAEEVKVSAKNAFELLDTSETSTIKKANITAIYWALITYYHIASERDTMRELTHQFRRITKDTDDLNMQLSALVLEGLYTYTDGDFDSAVERLESALLLINKTEKSKESLTIGLDNETYTLAMLSQVYWQLGQPEKSRQFGDQAILRAKEINLIPSICLALFYRAAICRFDQDKKQAKTICEELLSLASEYGLVAYSAYGSSLHCWATENYAPIDHIVAQLETLGCKLGLTLYASLPAEGEFENGDHEQAIERIDRCLQLCETNKEYFYKPNLLKMKQTFTAHFNKVKTSYSSK